MMAAAWPLHVVRRAWRSKSNRALTVALAMLLTLGVFQRADRRVAAPAAAGCWPSLSLGEVAYPWESPAPAGDSPGCGSVPQSQDCLRRTGHTAHLAVIGDSRGRQIYVNLVRDNPPLESVWQTPGESQEEDRQLEYVPGLAPEAFCSVGMCSSNATNEHISIRFLWQPFFDQHFLKALQTFVDECQQPRGTCPDMVLVNGGFWYSGRVPGMDKIAQHEQLTMLRQGVLRAAPALARLARRTLTLWKLEEAMLFEFVPDKYRLRLSKVEYMELLLVQQALTYELTLQVPELVIWSSLLPEVTRHMFHVCARRADRDNCPDPVHMGRSLQSGFSDTLMAVLCRRATAPRR